VAGDRTHPKLPLLSSGSLLTLSSTGNPRGMGGRLRIISSGGDPLPKSSPNFWAVGIPIYQGYGLTETSPIVSSNYPDNRMGQFRQTDSDVKSAPPKTEKILVKGPASCRAITKSRSYPRSSQPGRLVRTGDIGYLDKDNYLFITDRKKRLDQAARANSSPQPIENALRQAPTSSTPWSW